jgi:opacity protein-like surface antigen
MTGMQLYLSILFGASFSQGALQLDSPLAPPNSGALTVANYAPVARAAMGMHLNDWDFEVGIGALARWQESRVHTSPDTTGYNINQAEVDLRLRHWWQPTERWGVYGEGGVAFVRTKINQWIYTDTPFLGEGHGWNGNWVPQESWNVAPQLGVGVGYTIDEHWKITGGATWTFGQDLNVGQYMIGGRYTF